MYPIEIDRSLRSRMAPIEAAEFRPFSAIAVFDLATGARAA